MLSRGAGCVTTHPRILIVSPTFAPEMLGTPHYATDTARWFAAAGWDVQVVTAQPFYPDFVRHDGYGSNRRMDEVDGIPVYRLPTIVPKGGSTLRRAATDLNFSTQAAALGRRRFAADVTLSITPGTPSAVLGAWRLTPTEVPHVSIVHDIQSGLADELGMVKSSTALAAARRVERFALERTTELRTLTPAMASAVGSLGVRRPTSVLPLWSTLPAGRRHVLTEAAVQYSGNFGRKQGVGQLITAARELRRRCPGERILIRGAGSNAASLRQRIIEDGLKEIDLAPVVPSDRLGDALGSSPVHLVPQLPGVSRYVLPSKVINILATGGVVVAGGEPDSALGEIAAQTDALVLVPAGDGQALGRAAAELLRDEDRLEARRDEAVAFAAATFDRDRILRGLESDLLDLAGLGHVRRPYRTIADVPVGALAR